jgi:segregation and condensation protein A
MLAMSDYRVNLDIYNGPLDLLLYLIRRDEVDIYDIPIAAITEQYVKFVDVLKDVDPNLAGEFLVIAATLLELKTRMLLPTPPEEAGEPGAIGGDPRTELVRQLLQYKAFKDAAGDLAQAAADHALRFPRHPAFAHDDQAGVDLDEVQVWDLLDAFSRLMASIGKGKTLHEVIYDDTPVELHAEDIMDRLKREGPMSFAKIFEGRTTRGEIVGLFLALLELVRQKKIVAIQDANFGTINIAVNANVPDERPADFATHEEHPQITQISQIEETNAGAGAQAADPDETDDSDAGGEDDDVEDDDDEDDDDEDEFAELDEIDVPELDVGTTGVPPVDPHATDAPPTDESGQPGRLSHGDLGEGE